MKGSGAGTPSMNCSGVGTPGRSDSGVGTPGRKESGGRGRLVGASLTQALGEPLEDPADGALAGAEAPGHAQLRGV